MHAHRKSDARSQRRFVVARQMTEEISDIVGRKTLSPNPDHRRSRRTLNGQKSMEVGIECHDDALRSARLLENHVVNGAA